MTEREALDLLIQDIKNKEDLRKPENRWILHSIYVGIAAMRIAEALGYSGKYALAAGYIHDIGRRINHDNHPIEGYFYLKKLGYDNFARYSLTHSFLYCNINNTAGGGPKDLNSYEFINNYLNSIHPDIYDDIIHLCDLFCLETGFTTIEKRLLDITKRKGVYDNSLQHFNSVMDFKGWIELRIKKSLYDLFPEIRQEDLDNQRNDYQKLKEMLINKSLVKKREFNH